MAQKATTPNLEFYAALRYRINCGRVGDCATADMFDADPELKAAFIAADEAFRKFDALLDNRIEQLGEDPRDFDD